MKKKGYFLFDAVSGMVKGGRLAFAIGGDRGVKNRCSSCDVDGERFIVNKKTVAFLSARPISICTGQQRRTHFRSPKYAVEAEKQPKCYFGSAERGGVGPCSTRWQGSRRPVSQLQCRWRGDWLGFFKGA